MSTEMWIAIICMVLLATIIAEWWLLGHVYDKKNNTKDKELDEVEPIEMEQPTIREPWPIFATTKLDILTSARDDGHPTGKHRMMFDRTFFKVFGSDGIYYQFHCMFCDLEVGLRKRDYWGNPPGRFSPPTTPTNRAEGWNAVGTRPYGLGVDYGVLYAPMERQVMLGELKQPQTDRSDAMMSQLLAYAELVKPKRIITNPSEDPRYAEVKRLVRENRWDAAQRLEEKIWADIREAARREMRQLPPDKSWATTEPVNTDIREDVDTMRIGSKDMVDRVHNQLRYERKAMGLDE